MIGLGGFDLIEIKKISKNDFFKINPKLIKRNVDSKVVYLVKNVIEREIILDIRNDISSWSKSEAEKWMALDQDCTNFHRVNDCYEKSYVKTKAHTFYYNLWLKESYKMKMFFLNVFEFKSKISDFKSLDYLNNTPKDGFVSRVIVHHYPVGGGFMEEHKDPINVYNPIQTIIQASEKGLDYNTGGLYIRDDDSEEEIFIDDDFKIGDMLVFQPHIFHGVKPIDEDEVTDWEIRKGRYLIIPLSLRSDYMKNEESPVGVSYSDRLNK